MKIKEWFIIYKIKRSLKGFSNEKKIKIITQALRDTIIEEEVNKLLVEESRGGK